MIVRNDISKSRESSLLGAFADGGGLGAGPALAYEDTGGDSTGREVL